MPGAEWLSALSIFGVTLLMSLTTMLLNRKFANQQKIAGWQEEIKRWNEDKVRAKKTGDKKLMAKLRKQEKRVSQMQSQMLKGQLFAMVSNMGLFFIVWQALVFFYGNTIVAYLPFSIPFVTGAGQPLPYYPWYIICTLFTSTLLSRVLGVSMGMGMQPQTTK